MTAAELRRLAQRERARRATRVGGPSFDLAAFCGDHAEQYAFATDRAQWIHVMCARQSGKTWGDDAILLENALATPNSTNLLLHLTGVAVRTANWESIWRPLCDRAGIPASWHNETRMLTRFPNGSRVMFAGTDDLTHVKGFLGNSLPGGVVILDEGQDQKDSIIRYVLRQLLPPMLTPTTRVILSGVLPDVPVGTFLDLSRRDEASKTGGKGKGWSHHEWGRSANVHAPGQLQKLLTETDISIDDPQIQRDWFMRRTWDKGATAYGYDEARNAYVPTEPAWFEAALEEIRAAIAANYPSRPDLLRLYQRTSEPDVGEARFGIMAAVPRPGIDIFSASIDQGRGDRLSLNVTGWGSRSHDIQHVFEFSSPRNAGMTLGMLVPVMRVVQRVFAAAWWTMDGTVNELDTFQRDCGIAAIKAPNKADMPGQVRRTKNYLQQGWLLVMAGSAAEQDMQKAKFDLDARLRGQHKWSTTWHPDASESLRYSTGPHFDAYEPKDPRTPQERTRDAFYWDDEPDEAGGPDPMAAALGWRQ